MDLNQYPPEFDFDFLDATIQEQGVLGPQFCTQIAAPTEVNGPGPAVSEIRLSLEETHLNEVQSTPNEILQPVDGAGSQLPALENVNATPVQEDEVWPTPEGPHTGMTFDNLVDARAYYNSYARKVGFSIRTSTSRRSGITHVLEKIQYVCNKEGAGKKSKDDGDEQAEDSDSDDDAEDCQDGGGEQLNQQVLDGKKPVSGKKRKREKMKYTNCKARMVVKLIGAKWHVIYFIPEHNHDLIVKPSLKKFLRSHKGIPKEEKDFITLLHGVNLSSGRIMQLMSEFYGSAQLVPYEAKDVSNFRATLRFLKKKSI